MSEKKKEHKNNRYYFNLCHACIDQFGKTRLENSFGYDEKVYISKIELTYYMFPMECSICESDFICGIGITKRQLDIINREVKIDFLQRDL